MILEKIAADTKLRVEKAKRKVPYSEICRRAMAMDANTGFPFEKALAEPGIHYICEVKKASPSKGVIAQDFPYLEIAREYEKAGEGHLPERDYGKCIDPGAQEGFYH